MLAWSDAFSVVPTTLPMLLSAADLVVDHRINPWDAVILAAAAKSGCRLLLSEDLQQGFTWRGVSVVNPFTTGSDDLLGVALR